MGESDVKATAYENTVSSVRSRPKSLRKAIYLLIITAFPVWFITATARMAIQRIAAGTGNGPIANIVIKSADLYGSPMVYCQKVPILRRIDDFLEDKWCEVLDAPETTP